MVEKEVKEVKEVQERWGVQLAIIDENTPPKKIIVDTTAPEEEAQQYDLTAAIVKVLNNQERLMKLLD